MTKITNYLERLKALTDTGSVYAVAKLLELDDATVRNWYMGRSLPDLNGCFAIAKALDLQPLRIIVAVEAERSKSEEERRVWIDRARKYAVSSLVVMVFTTGITADRPLYAAGIETLAKSGEKTRTWSRRVINYARIALRRFSLQVLRLRGFGGFPAFGS